MNVATLVAHNATSRHVEYPAQMDIHLPDESRHFETPKLERCSCGWAPVLVRSGKHQVIKFTVRCLQCGQATEARTSSVEAVRIWQVARKLAKW